MTAESESRLSDTRVQIWVFAFITVHQIVLATVYWFASEEAAGTAMLALSGGLAAIAAGWLWVQDRSLVGRSTAALRGADAEAEAEAEAEEHYLPHDSVWPFGIGTGAFLALVGLAVNTWILVPGLLLLAISIVGFVGQTRRRD
ncbi:MAG: aa3-type cytochrome oxidase subunit IV [Acidimicrobiales bacterium]